MRGEAARWLDAEIVGKNWEYSNILLRTAALGHGGTLAVLRPLVVLEGAGGPNPNTCVPGSEAQIYSAAPANAAVTMQAAFFPTPAMVLARNLDIDAELKQGGGRPTDREPNGFGIAAPPARVLGQPLVHQGIRPEEALCFIRENFPTVVDERRRTRFNNIYQEQGEPVKQFYKGVSKAG